MPIRFHVDPVFYDHPKVTGMSDSAFSLWVRAGSYSAAKLTNGFVSENVLAHTLRSSAEVADELVHRGLWRRRKGGYVFHQWERRNLTKERVEADRKVDAARKRREREAISRELSDPSEEGVDNSVEKSKKRDQNGKGQVKTPNVRSDSSRNPSAVQPESEQNPDVSVSMSVSSFSGGPVSRGGHPGNAREERPPEHCSKHINDPTDDPCRACRRAREAAEAFDVDQARANSEARSVDARRRAADRAREIAACDLCGDDGYRNGQPCDHDPESEARAARGRQAVSAILNRNREAS
jgi:hypothetical protein